MPPHPKPQPSAAQIARPHRFSVAPMMDWTDRHCRVLMRLVSRRTRLYSEMITAQALVHGRDPGRFLAHDAGEHPLALQLGGSDPHLLATAARMGEAAGYDEINLNAGCPSDRVTTGRFGACLMAEPDLVAECVAAMAAAVSVPVTVKTRIGIDDREDDEILDTLVARVTAMGCRTVIVHARKALLSGLSPKENREIPPLRYDRAYRLKRANPDLTVVLNGGVRTLDQACAHLSQVDGVMVGRAAYERPFEMLHDVDVRLFGEPSGECAAEADVAAAYLSYAEGRERAGDRRSAVLRHATGLFRGRPGSRRWRQAISGANNPDFKWRDLWAVLETIHHGERLAA